MIINIYMMKNLTLFIVLMMLTNVLNSQTSEKSKPTYSIEAGYLMISDNLNDDYYLDDRYGGWFSYGENEGINLIGLNLKMSMETKLNFIDLVCGALFLKDMFTNNSSTSDYHQNGGGVYLGISPKFKTKHFGLTSDFGVGVLSFKKYMHAYYQIPNGGKLIDDHVTKASQGLGAMSSIGFYVNIGRFSINPNFMLIFSGGSNASFTYYGVNIPLVFKF